MSKALVQYRAVVAKEVAQTARDRRMVFMLVVAPIMQLAVLGTAANFDVDDVPTVVVDHDDSAASRAHTEALLADGTLRRATTAWDEAAAGRQLERGEVAAALIIPPGFGADLASGTPTQVQVLVDGSDPIRAGAVGGLTGRYFGQVALEQGQARARAAGRRLPSVRLTPVVFYNPGQISSIYMVPGIAAMLLLIVTTIVTAMGLAREKEMGTLEQVLVTPIAPGILLVGKLTPFVVIGLVDVTLALAVGAWAFHVPLLGSMPFLYLATGLYVLSTLAVGLLISALSGSQQQAFMGGFLFMLPAVLLSGNMTPIASMPEWMQPITLLNPVRYYVEVLRAVLLKGAGAAELWPHALALAGFGVGLTVIAALRFRKTTG